MNTKEIYMLSQFVHEVFSTFSYKKIKSKRKQIKNSSLNRITVSQTVRIGTISMCSNDASHNNTKTENKKYKYSAQLVKSIMFCAIHLLCLVLKKSLQSNWIRDNIHSFYQSMILQMVFFCIRENFIFLVILK